MTFTVTEYRPTTTERYTIDIETLDDLFVLGHERFGDAPMTIDWSAMIIVVIFHE